MSTHQDPFAMSAESDFSLGSSTSDPKENLKPVFQFWIFDFHPLIGHNWLNWVKITTFDPKVVEGWNKDDRLYFDDLSNCVEETFFVRPLVFEIIEIIG